MMRLDSANVDLINDVVAEHVRHSSVHMDLTHSAWAFCSGIHGIRLECWNHNLVSCNAVMVSSTLVFSQVILIDQGLSFRTKILWACNDWNWQEHVSLKCQTAW